MRGRERQREEERGKERNKTEDRGRERKWKEGRGGVKKREAKGGKESTVGMADMKRHEKEGEEGKRLMRGA